MNQKVIVSGVVMVCQAIVLAFIPQLPSFITTLYSGWVVLNTIGYLILWQNPLSEMSTKLIQSYRAGEHYPVWVDILYYGFMTAYSIVFQYYIFIACFSIIAMIDIYFRTLSNRGEKV